MNSGDTAKTDIFLSAEWYDRSINWSARLARELPVLEHVFGTPGDGGLVDAGCGTGRQACAVAGRGYRVVGADVEQEMLRVARRVAEEESQQVDFVQASYGQLCDAVGDGFDGIYCLGNALAAAGTRDAVGEAVEQFSRCLRTGGRLLIQVLNFAPMRLESPCTRGPRVSTVDGCEYVSIRHFQFLDDHASVTNVTLWNDAGWHQRSHAGRLYPVSLDELRSFCKDSGLHIDEVWGSYAREEFDAQRSSDLLLVATRV
jgi:glycine/sarcosine N-methyltransferase